MGNTERFEFNGSSEDYVQRARMDLMFNKLGNEIDRETAQLTHRIAENYHDAVKRNIDATDKHDWLATGNMKNAIRMYSNARDAATGRIVAGRDLESVNNISEFSTRVGFYSKRNWRGRDVLDYVTAQDEGDTTMTPMFLPTGYNQIGKLKGKGILKRRIPARNFRREAKAEALSKVDVETAKFMRGKLRKKMY